MTHSIFPPLFPAPLFPAPLFPAPLFPAPQGAFFLELFWVRVQCWGGREWGRELGLMPV